MKIIVCVDKKNGMMFNGRRQSRDRLLIHELQNHLNGAPLRIAPCSQSLFQKSSISCTVAENPLEGASEEEYCFVENQSLMPWQDQIAEVILYNWNRQYPADFTFDLDMKGFRRVSSADFSGASHNKITKEVWLK